MYRVHINSATMAFVCDFVVARVPECVLGESTGRLALWRCTSGSAVNPWPLGLVTDYCFVFTLTSCEWGLWVIRQLGLLGWRSWRSLCMFYTCTKSQPLSSVSKLYLCRDLKTTQPSHCERANSDVGVRNYVVEILAFVTEAYPATRARHTCGYTSGVFLSSLS